MNIERDKFLTEATGSHWKEITEYVDFSTWHGFGILWEWSIQQEWWYRFNFLYSNTRPMYKSITIFNDMINPDRFANAVYKFLKEKSKNGDNQ